ncbi:hypothetical protein KSC_104180 [Ktedonobacter sp. SOSP1-52]|nr:hypothetical protein KSC_104180 [Ktedonobacter sp. SOSP1-52]
MGGACLSGGEWTGSATAPRASGSPAPGVLFQVQGGKAPEESLIHGKHVPHLGRFANDEQGHHGACLEGGEKEIELFSTVRKVVDISDHHQFGLAFEETLQASFFVIGGFSLIPIWVAQGLKENF